MTGRVEEKPEGGKVEAIDDKGPEGKEEDDDRIAKTREETENYEEATEEGATGKRG